MRRTGEAEDLILVILGQEFANLLGKVMTMSQKVFKEWRDQEAWMVTTHGTELKLVASHFTAEHMAKVSSRAIPTKFRKVVFRSGPFNLKLVEDRIEALRSLIALLCHLKSEGCEDAFMVNVLKRV